MKKPYYNIETVEERFVELYGESTLEQKKRYENAFCNFKKVFNSDCAYIASSSGRVEVCGNHTDHNGGKVVSCAISLDALAMFLPRTDNIICIQSEGYPEILVDIDGDNIEKIGTSSALVRGVVVGLQERGYKVGGFNATLTSNVLGGAGISSSASFEVLIAEILNFLYNDDKIDNETKSKVAQFAENVYFGKPCGLLDQTAIAFGGLKKLDFSSKESIKVSDIECNLSDYSFILINTGGSHADLTDEYAAIPKEMKQVANALGKERLIDISEESFYEKLPELYTKLSDRAILRAVHFYEENKRVDTVASALEKSDYQIFLNAINESGVSSLVKLQNCYVSGGEEQLIPKALAVSKRYLMGGANRVHGGGFAGCILNIVKNENVNEFICETAKFFGKDKIIPLHVRSVGTIVL